MRRSERGIALLLCILSLMVLTGIAIGMMYMTDSETMINANYRSSQQAYFSALSGLQSVRERMTPANVAPHLIVGPGVTPGNPLSVVYVINPSPADVVDLAAITSALFGAGFYTLHHWKLESTSRGLLLIGTLLVPLNFLVLAGLTRGFEAGVVDLFLAWPLPDQFIRLG